MGMMEYWSSGILGEKKSSNARGSKAGDFKPTNNTHHSTTPSLQHSNSQLADCGRLSFTGSAFPQVYAFYACQIQD
jgi:hypothetical protein